MPPVPTCCGCLRPLSAVARLVELRSAALICTDCAASALKSAIREIMTEADVTAPTTRNSAEQIARTDAPLPAPITQA